MRIAVICYNRTRVTAPATQSAAFSLMDPRFRVEVIAQTPNPQQCMYAAMHQDYSEGFVYDERDKWPDETKAGEICVKRLLNGERGHYGILEHQQIILNCGYFPHSVMQQARTHRIGCCLSGDTKVDFGHPSISDGQVYYRKTIKELSDLWHRGRSHQRTDDDALYMQRQISKRKLLQVNESTGLVQHTSITNIYENGMREVWLVGFDGGKQSIKVTLDHKVLTPDGWTTFGKLAIGDSVLSAQSKGVSIPAADPNVVIDAVKGDEEWRVVPGFDWYEVSSLGRLRSWAPRKHRGKLVVPTKPRLKKLSGGISENYLYTSLSNSDGKCVRRNIHSLVLESFVSKKPEKGVARHLNGKSRDNRLINLSWGSEQENAEDRSAHGVSIKKKAVPVTITSFELIGLEETYDIEVQGPFHNFIANGIVVHNSFDCQSMRYTGDRICRAASGELHLEDVFYLRPLGHYTDRQGKKYEYTGDQRAEDLRLCRLAAERYRDLLSQGFSEEHARGILPFDYRQHFVVSFNARSFMHFLDLRAKLDAQLEIRQLCDLMWPHFKAWVPQIAEWYERARLHKARLAP
jgi:thymidylate synthase (FAD)